MVAPSLRQSSTVENETDREPKVDVAVISDQVWNVVVWDDPLTPMTVVVVILRRVFGYPTNRCTELMLRVHHEGRAIVWSGGRDRAESYCVKIQVTGLQATVEQDA